MDTTSQEHLICNEWKSFPCFSLPVSSPCWIFIRTCRRTDFGAPYPCLGVFQKVKFSTRSGRCGGELLFPTQMHYFYTFYRSRGSVCWICMWTWRAFLIKRVKITGGKNECSKVMFTSLTVSIILLPVDTTWSYFGNEKIKLYYICIFYVSRQRAVFFIRSLARLFTRESCLDFSLGMLAHFFTHWTSSKLKTLH